MYLLFAQHGWADNHHSIAGLARRIAADDAVISAPNLGWWRTWLGMDERIAQVEQDACQKLEQYPNLPVRIIGHSMGGLIWIELLTRYPQWRSRVHSLVVIGSPLGGSDLGRMFDPLRLVPLVARDLGRDRRSLARAIAAEIPTLSIASDLDGGSDGTVPIFCTQVPQARWVCLQGLTHAILNRHPQVGDAILAFWQDPHITPRDTTAAALTKELLYALPLTDCHPRDYARANIFHRFPEGHTLSLWSHPLGILHVYLTDAEGGCLYGGYAGWRDRPTVLKALRNHAKP